jgi:arginine decarboxylase
MEAERLELPEGEGSALLVAYGSISSDTPGDLIASAIAVGIPEEIDRVGVIMEVAGHFDAKTADEKAREMVRLAMENHGVALADIKSSSIEKRVEGGKHGCVISALAMW